MAPRCSQTLRAACGVMSPRVRRKVAVTTLGEVTGIRLCDIRRFMQRRAAAERGPEHWGKQFRVRLNRRACCPSLQRTPARRRMFPPRVPRPAADSGGENRTCSSYPQKRLFLHRGIVTSNETPADLWIDPGEGEGVGIEPGLSCQRASDVSLVFRACLLCTRSTAEFSDRTCAGINRHGVVDESSIHERSSDPSWP